MRAYANFLGLHPSALSRVLSGKSDLTSKSGVRVAKKLQLPADERLQFVFSIIEMRVLKELNRITSDLGSGERVVPYKLSISVVS